MKTNCLVLPLNVFATISNTANWCPNNTWTVEFWAKTLSNTGCAVISALPWFGIFFDASNRLNVQLGPAVVGNPLQNINTGFIPAANTWHHYAITRNGSDNIDIFIDKELWNGGPTPTADPAGPAPAQVLLGKNNSFTGAVALSDVRVWNYARSGANVAQNADNWIEGDAVGLIANWNFPEVNGTITTTGDYAWWPAPKPEQFNAVITVPTGASKFSYTNDSPVSIASKRDLQTTNVTARLDYGHQANLQHLPMMLRNGMKLFGLNASVFDASVFDNDYKDVYPEYKVNQVPLGKIKIMMSQPFGGLMMNDYISITQNIAKEYRITSNYPLKEQQMLEVRFPDEKTIHLRIVTDLSLHPLSSIGYNYEAVFE